MAAGRERELNSMHGHRSTIVPGGGAIVLGCATFVLAVTAVIAGAAEMSTDRRSEYNVKAVYLYSFGRYVRWPEGDSPELGDKFVIGVVGDNPFSGALTRIARLKKIRGQKIEVVQFAEVGDYRPCHILFFSKQTSDDMVRQTLSHVSNDPVLVVGEAPGFASDVGIVNFYLSDNSVRFEINPTAAKQRHLFIDAKLLSLAKIVGER